MAANVSDVNGFKAANMQNNTDFVIKLGNHSWRIQSQLFASKSGFFRAACNGDFKEAHERCIELHDDNIWDFGRFIQFIYLGVFESSLKTQHDSMPLTDIVRQNNTVTEEDRKVDDKRKSLEVCEGMLALADKYDVSSLTQYVAGTVCRALELQSVNFTFSAFHNTFLKTYEMLQPVLSDLPEIEDRLVALLLRHKLDYFTFDPKPCEIESILPGAGVKRKRTNDDEQDSKDLADDAFDKFREKLAKTTAMNATFTFKLATGLEKMLNKSWDAQKWTLKQKELLDPSTPWPMK